jgi:hypothetical protein
MLKICLIFLFFPCTLYAFWPLSWELNGEKRFLGPIASYERDDSGAHLTIRPLLFSHDTEDGGITNFLYPLGKRTRDKTYFAPFYLSKQFEDQHDTSLVLLFRGTSKKGNYYGFFPFYGQMYDRFGRDELGFVAWPFYSYAEAGGARKSNVLWPFFSFYSGSETGFKAWPLYGSRNREGVRNTQFFLWPIFLREQKDLDTNEPVSSFYAFPFYTSTTSAKRVYYNVLFPLFSYQRSEDQRKWGFLWNLYSKTEGKENRGYSIFPFVSREEREADRSLSLFWFLYKESEWFVKDERHFQRRVLIMNRYIEDDRGTFLNVWPFFEYRAKDSRSDFWFPSILPLRDDGYDRIIRPLITLYDRKKEGDKETVNLLYGLYTKEEGGDNWKRRFAFLFEVKKDHGGTGFEILSGLFGMDSKQVKILFIPIRRGQERTGE